MHPSAHSFPSSDAVSIESCMQKTNDNAAECYDAGGRGVILPLEFARNQVCDVLRVAIVQSDGRTESDQSIKANVDWCRFEARGEWRR